MGSQSQTRLSDWTELNWTVLKALNCLADSSFSLSPSQAYPLNSVKATGAFLLSLTWQIHFCLGVFTLAVSSSLMFFHQSFTWFISSHYSSLGSNIFSEQPFLVTLSKQSSLFLSITHIIAKSRTVLPTHFNFFFMEIFFFIEKLKTWVHQIKPISWGKKIKTHNRKKEKRKTNTVWAIAEPREYIL